MDLPEILQAIALIIVVILCLVPLMVLTNR
jgi:hypothetical protein